MVSIVGRTWEEEPRECLWAIHILNSSKQLDRKPFNIRWVKPPSVEIIGQFSVSWDINCNQGAKCSLIALVGLIRGQQHGFFWRAQILLNQVSSALTVIGDSFNQLCSYTVA